MDGNVGSDQGLRVIFFSPVILINGSLWACIRMLINGCSLDRPTVWVLCLLGCDTFILFLCEKSRQRLMLRRLPLNPYCRPLSAKPRSGSSACLLKQQTSASELRVIWRETTGRLLRLIAAFWGFVQSATPVHFSHGEPAGSERRHCKVECVPGRINLCF